jgi:hypothetical protein
MSEGSFWPKTWEEAAPLIVWCVLIFAFGFQGVEGLFPPFDIWRIVIGFGGMVGLTAMLIHWSGLKQLSDVRWLIAASMAALIVVTFSPFVEQRKWPYDAPPAARYRPMVRVLKGDAIVTSVKTLPAERDAIMPVSWCITINGTKVGPVTLQELKLTLATFSKAEDVLVWRDGLADWKPVRDLPELRFQTAQPPPLLPLPPAPSVQLDAMPSRSSVLSDISPKGPIAAIAKKAKKSMAPPITAANVIGAIAILAIFVFAFAMGEDRGTGLNPTTTPPAESEQYSTVVGKQDFQEFNDDIVQNNEFLAENPMYLDAILSLISRSGYECPRLAHLWLKGMSPLGIKHEALCGPRGSTDVYPALHYAVYPERFKVVVCKPFGAFAGSSCE